MSSVKLASSSLAIFLAIAALPHWGSAQDTDQPTLYVQVDCMKSTSPDYTDVETEIWQPMHQEMVNQGKKNSWALYWVLYGDRSDCDYYTVNTYRGEDQLNDDTAYSDVFASVHPGEDWEEATSKTSASREMVSTELWTLIDSVRPTDFQYAVVNSMFAEDGSEYVQQEVEIFKPVMQALVDKGARAGWGLYQLSYPYGTSLTYNYGTVDFMTHLGPVPFMETIREVHPDREVAAIMQEIEDARDLVHGEMWLLLARTQEPAMGANE